VTPYAFAPYGDLQNYISSYEHSLVLPVQDDKALMIAVLRGDKKRKGVADYSSESMIAFADIDNMGLEATISDAMYRLPHMIKSMDTYIHEVSEGNINVSSCDKIRMNTAKYYNRRAEEIRQKTLLIDSRYVLKVDMDDVYPYSYKIADKSEIAGAITNKKAGFCYLAGNYIFDAQTGDVLHMSYESPPAGKLTKGFFKELLDHLYK
jgi:hypothetical protein